MQERKYLPTLAELVDRLSIVQLKEVFITDHKEEYAKESIPMMPVTHGVAFTKLQIVLYTIILFIVSVLPYVVLMSGIIYLVSALVLSTIFLYYSINLFYSDDDQDAMNTFQYSIYYIFLIFLALLVDHYIIA